MIDLKGLRILFIGIGFYDYDYTIKSFLEGKGAFVYYFSSVFYSWQKRLCIRLNKEKLASKWSSKQILEKINGAPQNIDLIFIIKAEDFRQEHIDAMDRKYRDIPKILYLWDSLVRLPNRELLLKSFSRIITFDRKDAESYNLEFRPLFARNVRRTSTSDIKYDLSFIGFMHSIRYRVLYQIKQELIRKGIRYKFILTTGNFNKWYNLHVTHSVKKEDEDMLYTSNLTYEEYMEILRNSNVILDISHPKQTGLTMRTIETLSLGKKILTTNNDIINYSFNKNQYRVLNLESGLDYSFLTDSSLEESDMRKFTIDSFIEDIFRL